MSNRSKKFVAGALSAAVVALQTVGVGSLFVPKIAHATAGSWSGAWTTATNGGVPVTDFEERAGCVDPSNGGSAVSPDEADIASEADCQGGTHVNPGSAPSMYYAYEQIGGTSTTCADATDDWLELRMRVAGDPLENDDSNFKGTIWFWWFDTTGDGNADYYLQLNGANGDTLDLLDSSLTPIWTLATAPLSTGYANVLATPEVPAGDDNQAEYFIDVQFPISAFGANVVCPSTPFNFSAGSTSQEANNPTSKDEIIAGDPIIHGDPDETDVDIVKSVDEAAPAVGETVVYTVTLTNNGPEHATNVTVDDLLPAGVTFVSAAPAQGTYDEVTGIWAVGSIAASSSTSMTITVTIDTGTEGDTITNEACVSGMDQVDPDLTDCDDAVLTVEDPRAAWDISVLKTSSTPTPAVGSQFTYTVEATNNGPDDATGVVINDLLPTGVTYVSDNGAGAYVSATGVWTIGNLANGVSTSLQITVSVNNGTANTQITNTACFEDPNQVDPNDVNDCDDVIVTVQPVNPQTPAAQSADLEVAKVVNDSTVNVGQTIVYTVSVHNAGPNTATGVTMTDVLPAGLTFVSSTGTGTYNSATGVWTIGTLGVTNTAVLSITATVNAGTDGQTITNVAAVRTSDQADPDANDNRAQVDVVVPAVAAAQTPAEPTAELADTGVGAGATVAVGGLLLAGAGLVNARGARRATRKAYRSVSKKLAL